MHAIRHAHAAHLHVPDTRGTAVCDLRPASDGTITVIADDLRSAEILIDFENVRSQGSALGVGVLAAGRGTLQPASDLAGR
jgi:hypothetical protein